MNPFARHRTITTVLILSLCQIYSSQAEEPTQSTPQAGQVSTSNGFFSKSRWGASYLNYLNGPTFSEGNGGSINHYLTIKHKFSPDWTLSLVLRPDTNIGNQEPAFVMSDPYLRLSFPILGKDVKLSGDLIYFAPMSESSKLAQVAGAVSPRINVESEIGRLSLTYILIPKFQLNTQREEGQAIASHGHWAAVGYKVSSVTTIDFALYPAWSYKRDLPVAFNDLPAYPGVTFNFTENFSFAPYFEIPLIEPATEKSSAGAVLSYKFL